MPTMRIEIPRDVAGDAAWWLQHAPDDLAVARLRAALRSSRGWSPTWPRRLVRLAERLGAPVAGADHLMLLLCGFASWSRPWRLIEAFAVIA